MTNRREKIECFMSWLLDRNIKPKAKVNHDKVNTKIRNYQERPKNY